MSSPASLTLVSFARAVSRFSKVKSSGSIAFFSSVFELSIFCMIVILGYGCAVFSLQLLDRRTKLEFTINEACKQVTVAPATSLERVEAASLSLKAYDKPGKSLSPPHRGALSVPDNPVQERKGPSSDCCFGTYNQGVIGDA